jgi:hypothetical protein
MKYGLGMPFETESAAQEPANDESLEESRFLLGS